MVHFMLGRLKKFTLADNQFKAEVGFQADFVKYASAIVSM